MSIRLERSLPGFGHVRKATGLTLAAEFDELWGVLLAQAKIRPSVVRAWLDGDLSTWALLHASRAGTLDTALPDARTLVPLSDALAAAWDRSRKAGPETLKRYAVSAAKLLRQVPALASPAATVGTLATVDWPGVAAAWPGSPSDWMACYRMLSAFLTLHFGGGRVGRANPWRAQVLDMLPRKTEHERTPSCTLAQFSAAVDKLPNVYRAMAWTLVITGLRKGEFFALRREHLHHETYEVVVPGTYTPGQAGGREVRLPVSAKLWHWIDAAVPAARAYGQLHREWRKAGRAVGLDLTLHDLRHLMGQWAVNGGVAEAAVQGYLRHTEASTTRRYTLQAARREVADTMADILTGGAKTEAAA